MSDRDGLRIALKEWAVLAQAMGDGRIVAMVRKGGIRERRAGFVVRHERFFLYPTWFHEKEAELADRFRPLLTGAHADRPPEGRIRIDLVCDVAGVWKVDELERLEGITNEHGLTPAAVASRYRYRNEPGVQVVAVRVSCLSEPVEIPEIRRYLGCVSWVALDEPVPVDWAVPVLGDAEFEERVVSLERQLGPRSEVV